MRRPLQSIAAAAVSPQAPPPAHANHIRRLSEYLTQEASTLRPDDFLDIFGLCRQAQDPELTKQFLHRFIHSHAKDRRTLTWALQSVQQSRLPSTTVFEVLAASEPLVDEQHLAVAIGALKSLGDCSPAAIALCTRVTNGDTIDPILASSLLSFYSELADDVFAAQGDRVLRDALTLLDRLTSKGVELAPHHYGSMLVISGRCRASSLIQELWQRVEAAGFSGSLYSLTALMTALAHDKDFNRALDVFEKIVASGLRIKAITMTKLLDICIQSGEHLLGLRILSDWLDKETSVSWEVYRCALYLLNGVDLKDRKEKNFQHVLKHLKRKVNEASRKTSVKEKIPHDMVAFCLHTLYKHNQIDNPLDLLPYSHLHIDTIVEVVMSCAKAIIERGEWRLMLSLHERLRYHEEIPFNVRSQIVGYCFGLMLERSVESSPWLFLEQNVESLISGGKLKTFRFFKALTSVHASPHIPSILLHLKERNLLEADTVLDALTASCQALEPSLLKIFISACSKDDELKRLLRERSSAVVSQIRGTRLGADDAEEVRRILRVDIGIPF